MKRKLLAWMLTLAMLLGLLPAAALPAAAADLTIRSAADWDSFVSNVASGTSYSGQTVVLAADLTVTTMAGDSSHRFSGTFYGGGHTLTLNYTAAADGCAPFLYLDGATIKGLRVAGSISTGYKFAAGVAAHCYGDCKIQNCISSVTVTSSVSGDGTHAGFVAVEDSGTLNITNCLFDGSITGGSTTNCGGFVGWRNGTLCFTDCLMAGSMSLSSPSGSATFSRNGATLDNCYYRTAYGDVQGTQSSAEGSALLDLLGSGWALSGSAVVPDMGADNLMLAAIDGVANYSAD